MRTNIYIHAITAKQKTDGVQVTTTVVSLAASMEESLESVSKDLLSHWPEDQYCCQEILFRGSQQISQEVIDSVATKHENGFN